MSPMPGHHRPDVNFDLLAAEAIPAPGQAHIANEFHDLSRFDDEVDWDSPWIDLGGEG